MRAKKEPVEKARTGSIRRSLMFARQSDQSHVLGAGAFRAATFRVGHALSFLQFVKSNAIQIRHVKKHVLSSSAVDKTKSLVRQSLNRAFSHCLIHTN